MTRANSLPARPNLGYLKKLAKERLRVIRADSPSARLADAQLAVARQHGFLSWRQMKAHVETVAATLTADDLKAKVAAFLDAAVSHATGEPMSKLRRAKELLADDPRIASANLLTACVLGDAKTAREFLTLDPKSAVTPGAPRSWAPLLYLCFSRYLKFKPKRQSEFVKVARLLLDQGADPNSRFVHEGFNETALFGAAGIANRPRLTHLLLDAGADPNDRDDRNGAESLYHACEHRDNACLKLLLRARPRPEAVSWCLFRKLDFDDAAGAKLMLEHGADPNFRGPDGQTCVLHAVRRGRSLAILRLLQSHGAKLDTPDKNGMTPLKLARRLGRKDVIKFLVREGVADPPDPLEQLLFALAAGNLRGARKVLDQNRSLLSRLTNEDLRILPDAAAANRIRPVRHMLNLGFDINAKGDWGGSAVQQAAWNGHAALVKFLIHRGADLRQKNDFGGNALGTAIHGGTYGGHKNGARVVALVARAMNIDDWIPYLQAAEEHGNAQVIQAIKSIANAAPVPVS